MASDDAGHSKGYAFIEFEDEVRDFSTCEVALLVIDFVQATAQRALQANNHDLKNRRIAVTLADSRVKARQQYVCPADVPAYNSLIAYAGLIGR